MKTIITALCALFILLFADSCKNCGACHKYPSPDVELCRKDYATDDSYTQAFHYWEGQGYDCE